jgi:hypothetical protein
MEREPKIFAPDQLLPDHWIIGDRLICCIDNKQYVLTVYSDEPPIGLHFKVSSVSTCAAEIDAYRVRLEKRNKPQELDIDKIWKAVQDFASPSGSGRI